MTRTEHLLFILAEECAEVTQVASKAARFGMKDGYPDQDETNAQRLAYEMADLIAVYQMLVNGRVKTDGTLIEAKKAKVEKFLRYSAECGTLQEQPEKGGAATVSTSIPPRVSNVQLRNLANFAGTEKLGDVARRLLWCEAEVERLRAALEQLLAECDPKRAEDPEAGWFLDITTAGKEAARNALSGKEAGGG